MASPNDTALFERRLAEMEHFIQRIYTQQGYPLTIRQIQGGLGISSESVVKYRLQRLKDHGRVVYEPNVARTIRPAGERG